jgi:hypothetical protein
MKTLSNVMLLAWLVMATSADALNWYVSPSGSDTNDGRSPLSPFKNIQRGVDVAQPGDTINLASGTYEQDIITKRDGTSSAPITITGPASAVVKGNVASRVFEINHSFIHVNGFTIDGLHGSASSSAGYRDKLIYVQGKLARAPGGPAAIDGLKITAMTLRNAGGECMRLRYFVKNSEIANNTITLCGVYDFKFNGGGKNGEAIYIGTSNNQWADGKNPNANPDESTHNWVHHNTLDTQGNECVDLKEGTSNNLMEWNDCSGQKDPDSGGMDSRGDRNVFRHNTITGSVGAGVRLGGATVNGRVYGVDNDVYGNTLINNQYGAIKVMVCPQRTICGNSLSGNGTGVGSCGGNYDYTRACANNPGCQTASAGGGWMNTAFTPQTGTFTAEFDAKPSLSPYDSVIGLSNGAVDAFTDLAVIVRFNTSGQIDARNGGSYQAATAIPYSANTSYHFRLVVNVANHTYSAYVTPAGQLERTLGTNFAFRTEQASVTQLNGRAVFVNSASGLTELCNFTLSAPVSYVEATPSASGVSASAHDGNAPGNTVDNSLATRWSASGDGQWIRYDLGGERTLGYLKIAVYKGDSRRNRFELQVSSDGMTWSTVWSGESSGTTTAQETYDFADVSARYVRYLGHGNSGDAWNSLTEVDIHARVP